MTDKEIIIDGVDVKECIFYIDHNPPEGSGTWGGAIHKGACKLNSTACKHTPQCFIKRLYKQLKRKEQECEELKGENFTFVDLIKTQEELIDKYEQSFDEIEEIANKQRKFDLTGKTPLTPVINEVGEDFIDILDIINKAKEQ